MIEKNLAYIGNYIWEQCVQNINRLLSDEETKNFHINDYFYLMTIYNMDNPNLGEIAEALHLTKPAISAFVKRLSKSGLIEKVQSAKDGRVFYLKVTDKGKELIEGDNKLYAELTKVINQIADKEEKAAVDQLLTKLTEVLKKE